MGLGLRDMNTDEPIDDATIVYATMTPIRSAFPLHRPAPPIVVTSIGSTAANSAGGPSGRDALTP
jgi:hypothetical protein